MNDTHKIFLGTFAVLLFFFLMAVYVKNQANPEIETEYSNGFTFQKQGNFWYTTIQNPLVNVQYNAEFRYAPSEVTFIPVEGDPREFFTLLKANDLNAAYFTFDPTENLSMVSIVAADLSRYAKSLNGVTLVAACTKNETAACNTRPIVTCENQKDNSVVIEVEVHNIPGIILKENCLTIQGSGEDLLKAHTKLLFTWYSII